MNIFNVHQLNYSIIQQDTHSLKIIKIIEIHIITEYEIEIAQEYQHKIENVIEKLGKNT